MCHARVAHVAGARQGRFSSLKWPLESCQAHSGFGLLGGMRPFTHPPTSSHRWWLPPLTEQQPNPWWLPLPGEWVRVLGSSG
eukprot:6403237-Alexandrium_andersonii.AAC.1